MAIVNFLTATKPKPLPTRSAMEWTSKAPIWKSFPNLEAVMSTEEGTSMAGVTPSPPSSAKASCASFGTEDPSNLFQTLDFSVDDAESLMIANKICLDDFNKCYSLNIDESIPQQNRQKAIDSFLAANGIKSKPALKVSDYSSKKQANLVVPITKTKPEDGIAFQLFALYRQDSGSNITALAFSIKAKPQSVVSKLFPTTKYVSSVDKGRGKRDNLFIYVALKMLSRYNIINEADVIYSQKRTSSTDIQRQTAAKRLHKAHDYPSDFKYIDSTRAEVKELMSKYEISNEKFKSYKDITHVRDIPLARTASYLSSLKEAHSLDKAGAKFIDTFKDPECKQVCHESYDSANPLKSYRLIVLNKTLETRVFSALTVEYVDDTRQTYPRRAVNMSEMSDVDLLQVRNMFRYVTLRALSEEGLIREADVTFKSY